MAMRKEELVASFFFVLVRRGRRKKKRVGLGGVERETSGLEREALGYVRR